MIAWNRSESGISRKMKKEEKALTIFVSESEALCSVGTIRS